MIRTRIQNIGGAFPGRGAAPAMTKGFYLARGERTAIDRLSDRAAYRPVVNSDAGSLVAANDNSVKKVKKSEDAA
ncbi:hypothetical protein GR138_11955 [Shinella kummerowiae]|uniref:Uncharacterized protein n=1 Tax=Shinella kummerowiae TaxID=417745 RepID=A0A6N8SE97_9HYPH|nr:hypothetical protein [Shinella kummerowiae]MXN45908.1 hypothetical protein [Shinella kummerowiae]